jgi:hypothetical protein
MIYILMNSSYSDNQIGVIAVSSCGFLDVIILGSSYVHQINLGF